VPPPEFVDIQAAPPETTAISVITQDRTPPPAPVVAAPVAACGFESEEWIRGIRSKSAEEYYPDASKRANEEGSCILLMKVAASGQILDATVQTSSGFPRLDEACFEGGQGSEDDAGDGRRQAG